MYCVEIHHIPVYFSFECDHSALALDVGLGLVDAAMPEKLV